MTDFFVATGDITKIAIDAIVNAANSSLLGGGGVDGAIRRAAGPDLLHECRLLGGCKTGQAKITKGYGLPARFIIHTVGPVWRGGGNGESELLANCYRNSLDVARDRGLKTIAFPAISTGIYGYPVDEAARVAVEAITGWIADHPGEIDEVQMVCFNEAAREIFAGALQQSGIA
jgi:O-acetyl-ADP-ribose deacetylase (regulator of RNase III)